MRTARLRFVRRLGQLAQRVARQVRHQPISVHSAFNGTALERHRAEILTWDEFGLVGRHLSWAHYKKIRGVMATVTTPKPAAQRIVSDSELQELDGLFVGYLSDIEAAQRARVRLVSLQAREALDALDSKGGLAALSDPDALRAFIFGAGHHRPEHQDPKEQVNTLLALHQLLSSSRAQTYAPGRYLDDYRALVAWWGAWRAYQCGARNVERGFLRNIAKLQRNGHNEFLQRRWLTHKAYHHPVSRDEMTRLASDRPQSNFLFDPGHSEEGRRTVAMHVLRSGHDGFEPTTILGGRSPFEVLSTLWRKQLEGIGYVEGSVTALASYTRALVRAGEYEVAANTLADGEGVLKGQLTRFGAARVQEAKGLLSLGLYRETGLIDHLQTGTTHLQEAGRMFDQVGNQKLAQRVRDLAARPG